MSNLFVKVFREKVEELMPVKFELDSLDPSMDGYTLSIMHLSADGSYTISPTPVNTGFSGDYNDLFNKPSLASVATSGDYADLINSPSLFSGSWNDLSDKPALFDGQWNSIQAKPALIELGAASPEDGDIAVYDSAANDGNGGWVLRNEAQGELERIEELEITSSGQTFDFSSGSAAKGSTILMKSMITQTTVEFNIASNSVPPGRIFRLHFSRVTASAVQTMTINVPGDINGLSSYDMVRNQTVELLCTSPNEYIIL